MWALVSIISYSTFEYLDPLKIIAENNSRFPSLVYAILSVIAAFIFVYALGLIVEAASTISLVNKFIGTTPNIIMERVFVDERYLFMNGDMGGTITPDELTREGEDRYIKFKSYFAHVVFQNKKRVLVNSPTAERVEARIKFIDENNNDLLGYDFIGRWAKSPQPKDIYFFGSSQDEKSIDILQDEKDYVLDIAIKPKESAFMSAFNNMNYQGGKELLIRNSIINKKNVTVEVTLCSKSFRNDLVYKFSLINNGAGNDMDIAPL